MQTFALERTLLVAPSRRKRGLLFVTKRMLFNFSGMNKTNLSSDAMMPPVLYPDVPVLSLTTLNHDSRTSQHTLTAALT